MTIQQQLSISFWWVKTNQLKKWYPIFPIPGEDFTRFPKSGTRPTYALSPSRSYDPYDVLSCSWDLPSYWAWVITGAKSHGDTLVTQHWNSSLFQLPPGDFTWPCWLNYASSQWYPTGDTLPHAPCTCETCWVASLPRCLKSSAWKSCAMWCLWKCKLNGSCQCLGWKGQGYRDIFRGPWIHGSKIVQDSKIIKDDHVWSKTIEYDKKLKDRITPQVNFFQ